MTPTTRFRSTSMVSTSVPYRNSAPRSLATFSSALASVITPPSTRQTSRDFTSQMSDKKAGDEKGEPPAWVAYRPNSWRKRGSLKLLSRHWAIVCVGANAGRSVRMSPRTVLLNAARPGTGFCMTGSSNASNRRLALAEKAINSCRAPSPAKSATARALSSGSAKRSRLEPSCHQCRARCVSAVKETCSSSRVPARANNSSKTDRIVRTAGPTSIGPASVGS